MKPIRQFFQKFEVTAYTIDADFGAVYGKQFGFLKNAVPVSVGNTIRIAEKKI